MALTTEAPSFPYKRRHSLTLSVQLPSLKASTHSAAAKRFGVRPASWRAAAFVARARSSRCRKQASAEGKRQQAAVLQNITPFVLLASLLTGWLVRTAPLRGQEHNLPPTTNSYIQHLEDPSRAAWQKPDEVVRVLNLKSGENIADIGAGSGYFTVPFARKVGPAGKIYAVDIDREMLAYIEQRARQENLQNIQTVLADPHDPQLAPGSVDLIFICATLHHITDRAKYYPLLARALRPGGRVVNIDFQKRPLPVGPSLEMKIAREDVLSEFAGAGFHLAQEFDFLPYEYFLVFER